MTKRKHLIIGVLTLALMASAALAWLAPARGERGPDITYTTVNGGEITRADLAGRPTLVTFWATTCVSCVQEIPHLVELYEELNPRGLEIIAVAMEYDPPRRVEALVKARNLNYAVALDRDGRVAKAFGDVRLTPTTFLISPRGDIVLTRLGVLDMAQLRARIIDMLPPEQRAGLAHTGRG
ncbi:MAG: TlpA disulfide reductase family protein [Aquisalimonadaceae bacterium]